MARTKKNDANQPSNTLKRRRAIDPEARENQLIALAYNVAEQQLLDGTISSQVLSQLLKSGSSKGREELRKLQRENELLRVKAESIQSASRSDEIYQNALKAMKNYSGLEPVEDDSNIQ